MLMETFTKVPGKMVKPMATEFLSILKDLCMKANGKTTNNMEWEQKPGIKDKLGIPDNF